MEDRSFVDGSLEEKNPGRASRTTQLGGWHGYLVTERSWVQFMLPPILVSWKEDDD